MRSLREKLEQIKDDIESAAVDIRMALDEEDDIGPSGNDEVVLEREAWLTARGELVGEHQFGDDTLVRLVAYRRR